MDTAATRALIEKFNEARGNNDRNAIVSLLADDVKWVLPIGFREGAGGAIMGSDNVADGLTGAPGSAAATILKMDTVTRTVQKLIVEGDTAVGFHYVTAQLVNGGEYNNEYVWRYTCDSGKIVRIDEHGDTLHSSRQIGAELLNEVLLDD